ncbi:MAG: VanZ family protein [Sporolactobacillus sp.]|jgi:glycopeptide antibiotics resistance protein|nr:VanZ family protein [Sporolactobacillus sp.]
MANRILQSVFLTYVASVLSLTLLTHNYYTYGKSGNLMIFRSLMLMLRSGDAVLIMKNIFGNLLLFLPFGCLLPLVLRRIRGFFALILAAILFSFVIELAQYSFASRIFDIDDILLNTIGAVIGRLGLGAVRFCRRIIFFYTS